MTDFKLERELFLPVSSSLRRQGYRWQLPEVPFYEYRIDLYGYSRVNSASIAVELKLTNWRKALRQTIVYQLAADWVYAALPIRSIGEETRIAFAEHGIGLIGVRAGGRCERLLEAVRL